MDDSTKVREAAKILSGLGASKGGEARASRLTPERRSEIARKAVQARWRKEGAGRVPVVTFGSDDHPLRLGGIEIPCYVLDDGRRVLTQTGIIEGLDISHGGRSRHTDNQGPDRLYRFASGKAIAPHVEEAMEALRNPIQFALPSGSVGLAYEATVLAILCEGVLRARDAGALQSQQLHVAERCNILMRGFARVGITALVDEATGYQYHRERDSLAKILEEFVSKELAKWVKMFPDSFYEELFRLRQWDYSPDKSQRPGFTAQLTVDLIYERLAPGVLDELRRVAERDERGRLKHRLHQRLTESVGQRRLQEHIASVTALMKAFDTWEEFHARLDRSLPRREVTHLFAVMYDREAVAAADA